MSSKFYDWLKKADIEQNNTDNIFYPSMESEEAIDMLIDYLLGEDWYVVAPLSPKQVTTCAVSDILYKYSTKFKKETRDEVKKRNLK